MSEQRIQLAPPEEWYPRRAHIPYKRAVRWWSPLEHDCPPPAVTIFVSQRAYVRFCAHAGSNLENEVGGWLVGRWRADRRSERQFIVIDAILPARHVRNGSAFLTFTQDTQVSLYRELQERYPKRDLVGWYHTHPRMGVFLSEYDAWLHHNFFPEPYQVALVIEPHSSMGGFFVRQEDGNLNTRQYYGFYELNNAKHRSVVHWRNMFPNEFRSESDVFQGEDL